MNFDPRTKLIMVFLISSAAVFIREITSLFFLLLMTMFLCRYFSISLWSSIRKLRRLWSFFFVLAFIQSMFTTGGEVLVRAGDFRILTTAGLYSGVSIILRMAIIIYSALIIANTPALDIIYGLIAMKLPYEIAFMVLLAMKFLPLFREEFVDSITAVQLAGVDIYRIPVKKKLSIYAYILTPSVIKALSRARYISLSMECRGFRAHPERTSYIRLRMGKGDYLGIFAAATAIFMIISFNF